MATIEERLSGGHPNSLGNTVAVVEEVLADTKLLEELFCCYISADEVVRLRTSNAMKRIAKANEALLIPYLDRFLNEISLIDQPSTKWTLAQLFLIYKKYMRDDQMSMAREIMKTNLEQERDWIVINMTIETLANWAKQDEDLQDWLVPRLVDFSNDTRKSIASKSTKWLAKLEK